MKTIYCITKVSESKTYYLCISERGTLYWNEEIESGFIVLDKNKATLVSVLKYNQLFHGVKDTDKFQIRTVKETADGVYEILPYECEEEEDENTWTVEDFIKKTN